MPPRSCKWTGNKAFPTTPPKMASFFQIPKLKPSSAAATASKQRSPPHETRIWRHFGRRNTSATATPHETCACDKIWKLGWSIGWSIREGSFVFDSMLDSWVGAAGVFSVLSLVAAPVLVILLLMLYWKRAGSPANAPLFSAI